MKLANAIEGGLTGATTLTLLQETLKKIDTGRPGLKHLQKPGIIKKLKKKSKNGEDPSRLYIELAGELLSGAAYYGLTAIGKKKNAVLRGGLLGAAAGIGSVIFNNTEDDDFGEGNSSKDWMGDALTIALYTGGGLLAGLAVKNMKKTRKKKKKK